jgi:hypothetical protein
MVAIPIVNIAILNLRSVQTQNFYYNDLNVGC